MPDRTQIAQLLSTRLASQAVKRIRWRSLADIATGLSYAEVVRAAGEVLKDALIHKRPLVREADTRRIRAEAEPDRKRMRYSVDGVIETPDGRNARL